MAVWPGTRGKTHVITEVIFMSWNKKFTQGIVLSVCTIMLVCGACILGGAGAEEPAALTVAGTHAKAGIIASLEEKIGRAHV